LARRWFRYSDALEPKSSQENPGQACHAGFRLADSGDPYSDLCGAIVHLGVDVIGGNVIFLGGASLKLLRRKLVFAIAVLLLAGARGANIPRDDYRPEFTLDLHPFGYDESKQRLGSLAYSGPRNALTFTDESTLAISLFVKNPKPGLSIREKTFGGAYLFQTVFLDVKSGKVLRTKQWSNAAVGSGLFPTPSGGFVVWHDLELSLYAPDGSLLKTLALDAKSFPRAVSIKQSPGGGTLFAARIDQSGNHVLYIRTADLKQIVWLDLPGYFDDSGADSHFAFIRPRPEILPPMGVFVVGVTAQNLEYKGTKPIFTASNPGCNSAVFLDEQTLGISGRCPDLTIVDLAGDVKYHHRFGGALTGGIPCRECDLIFFGTYTLTGGSVLLDTSPKLKNQSVVLLNRKTHDLVEWRRSHFASGALSPGGCFLAIQNSSNVDLYSTCNSPLRTRLGVGAAR
jgi:hypothetical protein